MPGRGLSTSGSGAGLEEGCALGTQAVAPQLSPLGKPRESRGVAEPTQGGCPRELLLLLA